MEAILGLSASSSVQSPTRTPGRCAGAQQRRLWSCSVPCVGPPSSVWRRRNFSRVVTAAKKYKKGKPNNHPLYNQQGDYFPEAVFLRKETVREDGRVLPEFANAEEEKMYEFLSLQMESKLNAVQMRHYEVVYLIHEDCIEDVDTIVAEVQDFIRERKGRIYRLNDWGVRRLCYKIKKTWVANYILMNFELDAKLINDFKAMLDKDERIIRHLVMKRDKAITKDCPPPPEYHSLQGEIDDDDDDDEEEEEEDANDDEDGEEEEDEDEDDDDAEYNEDDVEGEDVEYDEDEDDAYDEDEDDEEKYDQEENDADADKDMDNEEEAGYDDEDPDISGDNIIMIDDNDEVMNPKNASKSAKKKSKR